MLKDKEVGCHQDDLHELLRIIWSFVPATSLQVAVESGFVDFVHANEPCSLESISEGIGWKHRPLKMLAFVLKEINIVSCDPDDCNWSLTPFAAKWLADESSSSLQSFIVRSKHLLEEYLHFGEIAESGKPSQRMKDETMKSFGGDACLTRAFGLSMNAMSQNMAKELMEIVDLNLARSMLDVGCGWGTFSFEFAKKWKQLLCDLLDLPGVINFVKKNIVQEGLDSRLSTISRNWRDGLPSKKYDVVLLSQVLHEETSEYARELFSASVKCLTERGILIVIGFHPIEDGANQLISAIFGMNMIVELGTDNPSPRVLSELARSNCLRLKKKGYLFGGRSFWIWEKQNT